MAQFGVPKPERASEEEIEVWKESLIPLFEGNRYRWKENDPFGSDAVYNTIAFVKFGTHHLPDEPLKLIAKQLSWFAYVMHLTTDGNRNIGCTQKTYEGVEKIYYQPTAHVEKI